MWRVGPWFDLAEANALDDDTVALILKRRQRRLGDSLVVITLDAFDELRNR